MAVKFGSDGTLYCNTVMYKYKQARNIIADNSYGNLGGDWTFSNVDIAIDGAGYKSYRAFQFNTGGTAMMTQSMPTPIANHKYYGGVMWKTTGSTFSALDNRFEWYCSDTAGSGLMVFANKNIATNGNWIKLSSIQSLSTVQSGNWICRNFLVNPSTTAYCCKMIIVDLTDTFGAGNEPTKEWCDNNIREWEVYQNFGNVSNYVTSARYKISSAKGGTLYNALVLNSNWEPREYMWQMETSSSNRECYISSNSSFSLTPTTIYYGQMECNSIHDGGFTNGLSSDLYFPIAEPLLGSVPLVNNALFNGGGGMFEWKRLSFYGNRTQFSSGSYPMRFDINNNYMNKMTRETAFIVVKVDTQVNEYNSYNGTSITTNDVNKEWCDRWIDGRSSPIIHIGDPANMSIKFNTNYDVICNDIEIRPEQSSIKMYSNGKIVCKKLVKNTAY